MNFYKLLYKSTFILLMSLSLKGLAQEQLMPLSGNIHLQNITENTTYKKKSNAVTPLNLPFIDDFSYAYKSPYPSAKNWADSNVFVNTGFAIAPITLGVATFDGLNKKGMPYKINAPVNYSESADTLTSNPINLQATLSHIYSPSDSIFLSFYYQAEGNGEAPEFNDSLCLEFFKPNQNKWKKVWGVHGYNPNATDTNFYHIRVAIADTAYCDSLFKFRFRNKATTSGSLDHWHIDYVQIKQNYFYYDTTNYDVAFAYKPTSFLKNYSVMPYRQYNQTLEMASGFRNYIRNNFDTPSQTLYEYTVKNDLNVNIPTDSYVTIANPGVYPFATNGYFSGGVVANPVFTNQPFPATFSATATFTINHILTTSGDLYHPNDTLSHVQNFGNYYAYDDGTAELGYYTNTYGAKIALRYTLNVLDTLKSVRVYFDPVTNGNLVQSSSFRLMVWSSNGSGPGNLIYKDSLMNPTYISGCYNLIPKYDLTSCLPLNVGTYFIGIQQTTNQPLNIGFDVNTNHKDALYYDIGNGWAQSSIKGSLMINPIMGCAINTEIVDCNTQPVSVKELGAKKNNGFKLFPNPAQNYITILCDNNNELNKMELTINSSLGQEVLKKSITNNESIDISNLSDGLYFIHLNGSNLNVSAQKLLITR